MADAHAAITVNMDERCTRCRRKGATESGHCLRCIARALKEETMRRRGHTDPKRQHAAEQAQPPLIPMSREELDEAAQDLAGKIAELEEMEADHAAQRKTMRDTHAALLATIGAIASTIRGQGR